MALDFNFAGPAGEQVFSTSPQISDVLARYFGTTPPAASASAAASAGEGGPSIGGTPLSHPLSRGDLGSGAHGTGFGSDNGVAGEARAFADRNTAVSPSFTGSLALAGALLPGGLGLPLAGPLGSLALNALGINTGDMLGGLGQTLGIGGSPFNVAGPSLSPEAIAGVLNSISGLPASAPRVTVMNALNDALAKARNDATIGANTGAGTGLNGAVQPGNAPATGGVDLGGLAGRMGANADSGGTNAAGGFGAASGLGGNSQGTNIGGGGRGGDTGGGAFGGGGDGPSLSGGR